jgi:Na+/H+ antiporter NhaD/arsenite permease-like protein
VRAGHPLAGISFALLAAILASGGLALVSPLLAQDAATATQAATQAATDAPMPVAGAADSATADSAAAVANAAAADSAAAAANAAAADAGHSLSRDLPLVSVLPFGLMLLGIAVFPLVAPHWWEHNKNRAIVAAVLAVPVAVYLLVTGGSEGVHVLIEKAEEYIAFIVLLTALFVISGGIYVQGSFSGTPLVNSAVLALGAVLANFIGTTGASMVLIRPLLRANASRRNKAHIVIFFIFVVSNCGGLLTPLGDPPLFLGFLKGVPFEWTLGLWKQWLTANVLLLVVFNIWDQIALNREEKTTAGSLLDKVQEHEPFRLVGATNIAFLAGVVVVIYSAGRWSWPFGVAEACMAVLTVLSYITTPSSNRERNRFGFGPIIEVAVLFAGIFVTMAPALLILNAWGQGQREVFGAGFGLSEPWQFFWASGILSSFLDNAPTYLTFSATACGLKGIATEGRFLAEFLAQGEAAQMLLAAISCGSVFMGANSYIGNGPNFMVKAIAEENGVRMPGFFAYMAYSGAILVPIFIVITLVFFR